MTPENQSHKNRHELGIPQDLTPMATFTDGCLEINTLGALMALRDPRMTPRLRQQYFDRALAFVALDFSQKISPAKSGQLEKKQLETAKKTLSQSVRSIMDLDDSHENHFPYRRNYARVISALANLPNDLPDKIYTMLPTYVMVNLDMPDIDTCNSKRMAAYIREVLFRVTENKHEDDVLIDRIFDAIADRDEDYEDECGCFLEDVVHHLPTKDIDGYYRIPGYVVGVLSNDYNENEAANDLLSLIQSMSSSGQIEVGDLNSRCLFNSGKKVLNSEVYLDEF